MTDDRIGLCCGHRVPRVPRFLNGYKRVYWCEECQIWKMSGARSTGVAAFDFLLTLRDEIERVPGFTVSCRPHELLLNGRGKHDAMLAESRLRLLHALGARVEVVQ